MLQNVCAVDLVVELVEAKRRLSLGLCVEFFAGGTGSSRGLPGSYQSPLRVSLRSVPKVGPRPSTKVTRLQRYHGPLRIPVRPCPKDTLRAATPRPTGPPTLRTSPSPHATPTTPVDRARCGQWFLTGRTAAFPVIQAGRRPRLHFRGLLRIHACCGLRVRWTVLDGLLSSGLQPGQLPGRAARVATVANHSFHGQNFHLLGLVHLRVALNNPG